MTSARSITVGPITFAEIEGDVYGAISARLDAAGSSWAGLARELGTSRQNLQRAMRLQAALKVETLQAALAGLAKFERRRPRRLDKELEAMGLTLRVAQGGTDDDALLAAAALIKSNRSTR